jgi:hypothetical protein
MRTARTGTALAVALALTVIGVGPVAVAQEDAPPHPALIQSGLCGTPGDLLLPLPDVSTAFPVDGFPAAGAFRVGAASALPVAGARATVPLSLSDLVASDHRIVIRASAADPDAILVCGDIGGLLVGETLLPIGLLPAPGSEHTGTALLQDNGDGSTTITLLLTQPGGGVPIPVGSPTPPASTTAPGASPALTASPSASVGPEIETVELDDRVWFAGFEIGFATATLTPATGELLMTGTFSNVGTAPQSLLRLQQESSIAIAWRGQLIPATFVTGAEVPGEGTVEDALRAAVPPDFTMDEAVLTLGLPAQHQALVPLVTGGTATSTFPRSVEANAKVTNRRVVTVTSFEATVVPATCDGTPLAVAYGPANASVESLVLRVREIAGPSGATVTSFAVAPGGASAAGTPGGTSLLGPRERVEPARYCYTLPSPIQGDYTITVESRTTGTKLQQRSFTVTIP